MKRVCALGIATAIMALVRAGRAEPTPLPHPTESDARPIENNVQPVRLSYAADSDCPSKEDFIQSIRERGLSVRESEDATRAMSVTLVRSSEGGQWNGTMRVHDAHGDASREVSAATCADVARSIALFASLALAPEAIEAPDAPKPIPLPTPIPPKNKPIRAMPTPPPRDPYVLHRDRFSLGTETLYFLSSQKFEDFAGFGVSAAYHFSEVFALGLSTDVLYTFANYPPGGNPFSSESGASSPSIATPVPSSEIALLRVMTHASIMLHDAHGTFDGRPGSPFDLFVAPATGLILTKPNNLPPQVSETYSPSPALEIDLGTRAFITQSFAVTAQLGFLFYEERYPQPSYVYSSEGYLVSAAYHPTYYGSFGPLFQLGAEFDFPRAPAPR